MQCQRIVFCMFCVLDRHLPVHIPILARVSCRMGVDQLSGTHIHTSSNAPLFAQVCAVFIVAEGSDSDGIFERFIHRHHVQGSKGKSEDVHKSA